VKFLLWRPPSPGPVGRGLGDLWAAIPSRPPFLPNLGKNYPIAGVAPGDLRKMIQQGRPQPLIEMALGPERRPRQFGHRGGKGLNIVLRGPVWRTDRLARQLRLMGEESRDMSFRRRYQLHAGPRPAPNC
jgi:hypothetical protein